MRLLLLALAGGVSLVAALQVARSARPGSPEAGRLFGLAIGLLIIGLLAATVGGDWLGIELDTALLGTFGVFFIGTGIGTAMQAARTTGLRPWLGARFGVLAMIGLGAALCVLAVRRSQGITHAVAECRQRYDSAREMADTLAVDARVPAGSPRPIGKYGSVMTCGDYRARGFKR